MKSGPLPAVLEHLRRWASAGTSALSDAELLARFSADREEAAFAALMQRHGRMVWGVCRHVLRHEQDAEDAFQATFLVLARKANSIHKGTAIASWLHATAYHIATRARRDAAIRRARESKGETMPPAEPISESAWREVLAILDEEVQRLSERQRAAFVLCSLEGKSLAEAARQLGWKEGTLSGTLTRAREQLRRRLARRGVTLTAVLAGLAASGESAAPAALVEKTCRAALAFAAGQSIIGTVSPPIASLVREATRSLVATNLHVLAVVLTAAVAVGGVAGFVGQKPESKQEASDAPAARNADQPNLAKGPRERTDRFGDPLPTRAVARIGTVRWWCGRIRGELVNTLVYTPDGKSLVFSGDRDTVHFLDVATGKELRRIVIPDEGRRPCFALAPNGKTLVAANLGSPAFHVWDVRTGKELRRIKDDKLSVDALAFTPDGKTFAVGTHADIWLWDTATWKEIRRIAGKDVGHYGGISFLADGKTLISVFTNRINWWDTATGQVTRRINSNQYGKEGGAFYRFAVSPDGKRLAAVLYRSSKHNLLLLWDAVTGKEVRRIEFDPKFFPSCWCFSPDSRLLACGSGNSERRYWSHQTLFFSAATGQELPRWDESDDHADQMAFSPDGKILAQAMSGVLRLLDVKTGKPIGPVRGLPNSCVAMLFSRDGKSLIAGCRGGRIGTWDPFTGAPLTPLRNPPEGFVRQAPAMLLGTTLTADGERGALVDADGMLHIWEPATGKELCRIADPPVVWDQADFSPDGRVVSVKHKDDIIRLWDARTGKLIHSLPRGGGRFPQPRAFSPDGRTLAIGPDYPDKGIIHLFETATGKEEGRIVWRDSTDVNDLLFTPDGKYLLAAHRRLMQAEGGPPERGDEEDALRLWDRASGREVRRIRIPVDWFQAITISRDGKTLAASVGGTILLWELASGAERGRFSGHREGIRSLAFSPDSRLLASGSFDHTACVWDVTGICLDGKWSPRPVKQDELERLWTDLGNKDGVRGYRALWRLAAAGPPAVAFLAQRLRPVPRVEEERLARLIADLDSDRFETRERASVELQRLGEQAESALRKALASKPSLEASRRLRALLDRVERRTLSTEQLHALRAVEVLEHVGTAEARTVLRSLAAGAPADRLTREAKASLQRLSNRTVREP